MHVSIDKKLIGMHVAQAKQLGTPEQENLRCNIGDMGNNGPYIRLRPEYKDHI
jgi:hypothetical protein